jgi:hypothetical protein
MLAELEFAKCDGKGKHVLCPKWPFAQFGVYNV